MIKDPLSELTPEQYLELRKKLKTKKKSKKEEIKLMKPLTEFDKNV
jgi:hypothetical protein